MDVLFPHRGYFSAQVSKANKTPAWVLMGHGDGAVCGRECVFAWRKEREVICV